MSLQRRLTALLLFMAYAITGTSLLPAFMVILASLDGSHSIQVRESDEGTQLVLHHSPGHYTPEVCNHEKTLAKMIVSLCSRDQEGDHSLISAHIEGTVMTERNLLKEGLKNAPALNLTATLHLVLITPTLISCSMSMRLVNHKLFAPSRSQVLTGVQLLI